MIKQRIIKWLLGDTLELYDSEIGKLTEQLRDVRKDIVLLKSTAHDPIFTVQQLDHIHKRINSIEKNNETD